MSKKKLRILSWSEIYDLCKTSFLEFLKEDNFTHGAALAYYAIFALVPTIYLSVSIFGSIVGEDVMISIIESLLHKNIGISDVSGITEYMKQLGIGNGGWFLKIVGGVVLMFSATAILNALRNSINEFFDIKPIKKRNAILQNLISRGVSIGILSVFALVLIVSYFAQIVLFSMSDELIGESSGLSWFMTNVIEHGLLILVNTVFFAFVFKYLHDGYVRWKLAWAGALFTSILLYFGQLLIKYYLVHYFFAKDSGVAGTLLVILTWMFYTSQIIFLGAKFTAVYAKMVGKPIVVR